MFKNNIANILIVAYLDYIIYIRLTLIRIQERINLMESLLDKFTNSTYKVLRQIYDCQMKLPDGTSYIPISQAELARIIGVSTITMNKYFKQFQEDGIITSYGETKGKYQLTDTGIAIIKRIEELDKDLEGGK